MSQLVVSVPGLFSSHHFRPVFFRPHSHLLLIHQKLKKPPPEAPTRTHPRTKKIDLRRLTNEKRPTKINQRKKT